MSETEVIRARSKVVTSRYLTNGRGSSEVNVKKPNPGTTCDDCLLPKLVKHAARDYVKTTGRRRETSGGRMGEMVIPPELNIKLNCDRLGGQIRSRAELEPNNGSKRRSLPDFSISKKSPCSNDPEKVLTTKTAVGSTYIDSDGKPKVLETNFSITTYIKGKRNPNK